MTDKPAYYPLMELSIACSSAEEQEKFWVKMFDAKVIFRGHMMGHRFSRLIVCGISIVFREDPDFVPPPGPGEEVLFNNHIGLRVADVRKAVAEMKARGAQFVLEPDTINEMVKAKMDDGHKIMETDYIAPPLNAERVAAGEYKIEVSIMAGPDNLWIELNQITEPEETNWFPGREIVG